MDIATLGIAVKSDQVDSANRSLEKFAQVSGSAERAAKGVGSEATKAGRMAQVANDNAAGSAARAAAAYGNWERAAVMVGRAVGAIAGALATGALIQYADAWSDMQSRVGAAIRDMDAAPQMMQRLVDIANASYSPLDQTVEVYSRNVAVLRDMGGSAKQAADFTEALNHALVITATRGERAASVQNALSKAMAVGRLQADGLETILANGGAVAEALAAELGTTVNGLRKMASEGKITGDVMANALINRLGELRDRAAEMPATVGDAFTRLRTNLTAFIGQIDQSGGYTERLSGAIMAVADNLSLLARVTTVAGSALLVAFAPALLSQIAFGLGYIGAAGVAAMRAITVAAMANPLGLIAVGITTALVALYQFRDEIRSVLGDDVFNIVKGAANFLINSFRAAFEDIKFVWSNFGNVLGAAVIGGVNLAIKYINTMVQGAAKSIDTLISHANRIPGVNIPLIGNVGGFSEMENPHAANLKASMGGEVEAGTGRVSGHIGNVQRIMANDNFASSAQEVATSAGSAEEAVNKLSSAIDAAKTKKSAAEREAERLAKAYDRIKLNAQQFIEAQQLEAQVLGMTEKEANRLRYTQDLLNQAQSAGIKLTSGQKAELEGLAASMADAEAQTSALQRAMDFAKEVTSGFMNDFKSGLEQGKGVLRSFADAALNALSRIADKLIQMAMDNLWTNAFGGMASGGGASGGGLFQSLFGGLGKMFGFSTGGWTGNGPAGAAAGVVHGQEFVVRAGPAAQHRQLLEAINSGRPVSANNNAPTAANFNYAPVYNIAQGADPKAIAELRQAQAQDRASFEARAVATFRKAQSTRAI